MHYPLIGLTGFKGSGKDTVAAILCARLNYTRYAWADALKREVYDAFGRAWLGTRWHRVPTFEEWMDFLDSCKYDAPESPLGWVRPLLQFWGTEYRRRLCSDSYWIDQLIPHLAAGVVVTDCRFPNEIAAIRAAGGVIWRIDRPDHAGDGHVSERNIMAIEPDVVVRNCQDIAHLERMVLQLLRG